MTCPPGRSAWASLRPGNSHSRGFQPLLAIPDAPPACFVHRTRQASVPLAARAGSPSQVQCCTLPEHGPGVQCLFRGQNETDPLFWGLVRGAPGRSPARCFRHWRRARAHLAKYNVAHCLGMARARSASLGSKKENPHFCGGFPFWNPAVTYSPGPSPAKYHRR